MVPSRSGYVLFDMARGRIRAKILRIRATSELATNAPDTGFAVQSSGEMSRDRGKTLVCGC